MAAELPAGWAVYQDPEGRSYYANAITGESSYDPPTQAAPLPPGWEARSTDDGKVFYANLSTGETSWDPPVSAPPAPLPDPNASSAPGPLGGLPVWAEACAYQLGGEGSEHTWEGNVPVLPRDHTSVRTVIEALNNGSLVISEGYCIVYSASRQAYFLLWREDKEQEALAMARVNLSEEPTWSIDQAIPLGGEGCESSFEGKIPLLDRVSYFSVSAAVDALSVGQLQVDDGLCVVWSDSQASYFLLYRGDKAAEAEQMLST
mmetsp:Transcript_86093/g.180052  ORF Transcript_86093/g.180052 Transcript_86093/m.180052 type:complete len:261 (-) Transcript_86093:253-1035(-)